MGTVPERTDPRPSSSAAIGGATRRASGPRGRASAEPEGLTRRDQASLWSSASARSARRPGSAVKAGCDLVVAVGGDGTVLQVATALAGEHGRRWRSSRPGTGNLLAGNLGIPHDLGRGGPGRR